MSLTIRERFGAEEVTLLATLSEPMGALVVIELQAPTATCRMQLEPDQARELAARLTQLAAGAEATGKPRAERLGGGR